MEKPRHPLEAGALKKNTHAIVLSIFIQQKGALSLKLEAGKAMQLTRRIWMPG